MGIIGRSAAHYRASRRANYVPGRLLVDGDDLAVMVLNISRDGAKISLRYPIMPGTAVELRVKNQSVPALVQWSGISAAGLRFLDRLDAETLVYLEGGDARGKGNA